MSGPLTAATEHVAEDPSLYCRVRGETRRAILGRFPYAVYFRLMGHTIGLDPRQQRRAREVAVTGTIRTLRVDKGFGFIKDESGNEYFFHQSAIYGEGIGDLREGDSVEFDVGQGPKGPRAENVKRTST